jgi:hypothetical protein
MSEGSPLFQYDAENNPTDFPVFLSEKYFSPFSDNSSEVLTHLNTGGMITRHYLENMPLAEFLEVDPKDDTKLTLTQLSSEEIFIFQDSDRDGIYNVAIRVGDVDYGFVDLDPNIEGYEQLIIKSTEGDPVGPVSFSTERKVVYNLYDRDGNGFREEIVRDITYRDKSTVQEEYISTQDNGIYDVGNFVHTENPVRGEYDVYIGDYVFDLDNNSITLGTKAETFEVMEDGADKKVKDDDRTTKPYTINPGIRKDQIEDFELKQYFNEITEQTASERTLSAVKEVGDISQEVAIWLNEMSNEISKVLSGIFDNFKRK